MRPLPQPPAHLVKAPPRTAREVLIESGLYDLVKSAGDIGSLAVSTVKTTVLPPYPWIEDAVIELSRIIRRCALPLGLSMFSWVLGYAFFLLGGFVKLIGAADRVPGGLILGFTREPSVWVCSMIFGGVAGAAITSDLAARKNREELDALAVLGVEQTRVLVVPRVVACTVGCLLLGLFSLFVSFVTTWLMAPGYLDMDRRVVLDSIIHSTLPGDIFSAMAKFVVVGFLTGVISCHKGLTTKPGTEGVGRAVNQNIVLVFLAIWIVNSVFNLAYLSFFPQLTDFKG